MVGFVFWGGVVEVVEVVVCGFVGIESSGVLFHGREGELGCGEVGSEWVSLVFESRLILRVRCACVYFSAFAFLRRCRKVHLSLTDY